MPYKEKEIEKLYYSIGEVAAIFNVNTSHIRFWSKEFDVIRPATNKKGNRLFTQSDIDNLKKIYHLVKEKGYTLKGAKVELKGEMKSMKTSVLYDEIQPELFPVAQLQDNPVEMPASVDPGQAFHNDYVDKIAIKSSLEKIKSSLMDIQKDLVVLEEK